MLFNQRYLPKILFNENLNVSYPFFFKEKNLLLIPKKTEDMLLDTIEGLVRSTINKTKKSREKMYERKKLIDQSFDTLLIDALEELNVSLGKLFICSYLGELRRKTLLSELQKIKELYLGLNEYTKVHIEWGLIHNTTSILVNPKNLYLYNRKYALLKKWIERNLKQGD